VAVAATAAAAAVASMDTPTNKKPHPVPGEKDAKGKMLPNSMGKKNCFNCGGNDHWVVNCHNLTTAQCEELAGMVHISLGDDKFKGIGFLQNESSNPCIIAMRNTLDPQQLYLESMAGFYQVFKTNTWTTYSSPEPPFALTAMPAPTLPPKKAGITTCLIYGSSTMELPIFSPSPS
jgi:hypothetical protein